MWTGRPAPTMSIRLKQRQPRSGQLRGSTQSATRSKGASVSNSEKTHVALRPPTCTSPTVQTSSPMNAVS